MRRWQKGVLVSCAVTAAGLTFAEVVVRAVAPASSRTVGRSLYVADAECGYVLRPDLHPAPKPKQGRRLLVLGDSFAWGSVAADDAFPALLAKRLGADLVNAGVPGYGTAQQAAWMTKYGRAFLPDAVLVAFFVGNDVLESRGDGYRVEGGELVQREAPRRSWFRRLRNRSHLYRHLKQIPRQLRDRGSGDSSRRRNYHKSELARMALCRTDREASWAPAWKRVAASLRAIRDAAAPAPVVVLVIPDEYQVDASVRDAVLTRVGGDSADYDLERPQRTLAKLCTDLGLEHVDVLAACRAAKTRLYLEDDSHWNPTGHALATEQLLVRSRVLAAWSTRRDSPPR